MINIQEISKSEAEMRMRQADLMVAAEKLKTKHHTYKMVAWLGAVLSVLLMIYLFPASCDALCVACVVGYGIWMCWLWLTHKSTQ